jgi:hypothetical protein
MAMKARRGRQAAAAEESTQLIEPETLAAGGCRRDLHATLDLSLAPQSAVQTVDRLCALEGSQQPAVALALGFEYDPRRLRPEELLRRLIFFSYLRQLGARIIIASPVLYQSRPRWDLYSPDKEILIAVNHLTHETEIAQHIMHRHAKTVLWAPVPDGPPIGPVHRYSPTAIWTTQRNWFEEMVRQNERQSAERREARVVVKGIEDQVDAYRTAIADIVQSLDGSPALKLAQL